MTCRTDSLLTRHRPAPAESVSTPWPDPTYTRLVPGPAASPDLRARARESGSKVARRMLDQPLSRVGVLGAVVLLAATAAFGGLEEEAQDGPEVLAFDVPADVAPFELTVHRVVWTTDLPGQYLSEKDNRWIGVVATVRNTSDAGVLGSTLSDALTVQDVDGLIERPGENGVRATSTVVLADGSSLNPVQPGLTYEAAFLFEQDGDVPPPERVTVQVQRHTWRGGALDSTLSWRFPTTALRGELDARAAADDTAQDDA
ncbi:hypothetical protein Cfla_1112 [Cellulomonas flavigena DSM 20109]|uniref:DUF4352 domain-containing protein n=1 Tax=Cellulomonas flavigena (strain ATCC 482 / DSM 20109 / BCRC 11376 / JCM 18109 / NBRC 3775 / NCIMB 8073 / NRS 134) TaxID=446466 RepID=D5ULH4_CELFN|nr:hypothetical protein Cfla_1112 [Cellulomonas flavigena DSM 20109]